MAYSAAKKLDIDAIPLIDVAPMFEGPAGERHVGRRLLETVDQIGFFYIEKHGVPETQVADVFSVAEKFFKAPEKDKESVRAKGTHRGFLPIGEATMPGNEHTDLKESFIWGWDVAEDDADIELSGGMLAANRWPHFLPEMSAVLMDYIDTVNTLGVRLLRAFAAGLDLEHDTFVRRFAKPLTRGAIIYYPPQPEEMSETQFGVGPHTDYGCITLLHQDETGGLQVKHRNGDWLTADPIPGTFVVNVGDLLHRWSNDRFLSNSHRVINASGRERYSVPIVVDPDWDTVIDPVTADGEEAKYAPTGCAEYIRGLYEKSFAYRKPAE